ncbi:MAG TPA: hypothetical protein VLC79_00710 [Cellvibrio sp.]|nr:hypothetical protein [Cellvibrio sp.]
MITGASHSLNTNLTESLNYYRQQLEQQRLNQSAPIKTTDASTPPAPEAPTHLPAPVEPTPPKSFVVEGELNQIPLSTQIQQATQERRDLARAAAVSVESLQHKQDVVNVYTNAVSDSTENDNAVSPAEVYQETLEYQKREDLMMALQKAVEGGQLGNVIDITI